MPTGFTAPVEDGTITELADYLTRIAGAFMWQYRDELPLGAPIPVLEIVPPEGSEYNRQAIADARANRDILMRMSHRQIRQRISEERDKSLKRMEETNKTNKLHAERYSAMLKKVKRWKPPTPEHVAMKEFAMQQIRESMVSCKTYTEDTYYGTKKVTEDPETWRDEQIKRQTEEIEYYTKQAAEEHKRSVKNAEWANYLRKNIEALRAAE